MKYRYFLLSGLLACWGHVAGSSGDHAIPQLKNGFLIVEAEAFEEQTRDGIRKWRIIREGRQPEAGDPAKWEIALASASTGAFVTAWPDTRVTHDDPLVPGENFSNQPGRIAVLHYPVEFDEPGRYYVWVRAYSTGTEDNGIHVGLNGEWPESGQRMQWCAGKNQWTWESRQRTRENHCGEPGRIYLDIPTAGRHVIQFSMREDGFAFDQFLLMKTGG